PRALPEHREGAHPPARRPARGGGGRHRRQRRRRRRERHARASARDPEIAAGRGQGPPGAVRRRRIAAQLPQKTIEPGRHGMTSKFGIKAILAGFMLATTLTTGALAQELKLKLGHLANEQNSWHKA